MQESKAQEVEGSASLLSISQSLLKNFWDYKKGEYCGILFHKSDILKLVQRKPTAKMTLGHYYEYLCTGATLRDGSIPDQPQTKTKKPTAEAVRMKQQAAKFKLLVEKESIHVESTGDVLEVLFEDDGFKMKGVLDIYGAVDGNEAIIDIKSSGLIGNQWEAYGWNADTFNMREKLTIQVVFYKYLAWKKWGVEDVPFYFIIGSTTNNIDSLYWRVDLHDFEVAMTHLEDMIFEVVEEIKLNMELGFTPYPSVKRCGNCPVEGCSVKAQTPALQVVTIDGIYET